MWALWETALCAGFQRPGGRVFRVHRSGSVPARIFRRRRRTDPLVGEAVDASQPLVDPLRQDERIETRAELSQRPDLRRGGFGTRLHALERRPRRFSTSFPEGRNRFCSRRSSS